MSAVSNASPALPFGSLDDPLGMENVIARYGSEWRSTSHTVTPPFVTKTSGTGGA
jgi:hypothetical protein